MYRFRSFRLFFGIHTEGLDNPEKKFNPEEALDDRIKTFETAAETYKLRFRVFQVIVILASGIIPIINLSDIATPATRIISSMLGSLILIVTGITQMDKNHEMWILKASVEHALKREKLLFVNDIKPYNTKTTKGTELVKKMNEISSSFLETYFRLAGDRGTTQVPERDTTRHEEPDTTQVKVPEEDIT